MNPTPAFPPSSRSRQAAVKKRAKRYWHRGSPWILGPLLVGLAAVVMALGAEYATGLNDRLYADFPLASLFLLPAWFALACLLTRRFFPGAQGSGIPQAIAALETPLGATNSHLLSLRIALGKILLTIGGLLFGASIGREGPTVQVGASIMHAFYMRSRLQQHEAFRRTLIIAGGAAGIAAAFNTPLAGLMFAIEEMSKKHVFNANSSVLMTVVLSGLIPLFLLGNYTYFGSTGVSLDWQGALPAIIACGVMGGMAGGLFSRLMQAGPQVLPSTWKAYAQRRPIVFAGVCGLGVAVLGFCTDGLVFGTGYAPTRLTLEDTTQLPWYFGVAKMLATLLSAVSGIPGGIFAPSLAVGAGFGDNLAELLPSLAHGPTVLLAMAAYLAGVTRAPVTAFIIMMEMTDTHHLLLPLMAAALIANGVSRLISPPLYHSLADRFVKSKQAALTSPPP